MNRASAQGSWADALAYMALIFIFSALSFRTPLFENTQKIHVDKIAHIVEYSLLGFLLARAWQRSVPHWKNAKLGMAVLAVGVFYAATDEFHQSFVPSRKASVYDGIADTLGLSLGCWMRLKKKAAKNA